MFFIRGNETENPMNILNRGYWVTTILSAISLALVTNVMMSTDGATGANGIPTWVYFFGCGVVGLATSIAFVYITQYYTAGTLPPRPGDRRGLQDRPGHEHHRRHRPSASRRPPSPPSPSASPSWPATGSARTPASAPVQAASSAPPSRRWAC